MVKEVETSSFVASLLSCDSDNVVAVQTTTSSVVLVTVSEVAVLVIRLLIGLEFKTDLKKPIGTKKRYQL